MRSRLALCLTVLSLVPRASSAQQTTSQSSTYAYSAWELTRWKQVQWRSRCEGGQRGMESGPPIRWTVEFRNRSKDHPVTLSYSIAPPEPSKRPSATGRVTIKPKGFFGAVAIVDTDRCGNGMRTAVSQVKYGVDVDSVPLAPPDATDD